MANTPNMNLKEMGTELQRDVYANDLIYILDHKGAGAEDIVDSPSITSDGTVYLVSNTPSGDFVDNPNEIAYRKNRHWIFIPVQWGAGPFHNKADELLYVMGQSTWEEAKTEMVEVYDIVAGFVTEPAIDTAFTVAMIPRTIVLGADFDGSVGFVDTLPSSNYTITVDDDGQVIGFIDIESGGTVSFMTESGIEKTIEAGSVLKFISPSAPDGTIVGVSITLNGSIFLN